MSGTAKGPQPAGAKLGEQRHGLLGWGATRGTLQRLAAPAWPVNAREALLITTIVAWVVLGTLAGLALVFADRRFALWAGIGAVVCLVVAIWRAVIEPVVHDDSGKGEVSKLSHEQFERLVEQVDRAGATASPRPPDDDERFEQLVREALDELPDFLQAALSDNVAVLVSDDGAQRGCYGLYHGGTVAAGIYGHTIVIYRDTLVCDFGHDPEELRRHVAITVRHEVAHHLGAGERRVAELGL